MKDIETRTKPLLFQYAYCVHCAVSYTYCALCSHNHCISDVQTKMRGENKTVLYISIKIGSGNKLSR